MPTDKEIQEAIEWANKIELYKKEVFLSNYTLPLVVLKVAYLEEKAKREKAESQRDALLGAAKLFYEEIESIADEWRHVNQVEMAGKNMLDIIAQCEAKGEK